METEPGKLFIGGISWDTSVDGLRDYFQTFGEVVEAVIMKDRTTGRARGFGFIVFADAFVAENVARERHVIDGRTVEAKKAVPREDHQSSNRNNGSSTQGSPTQVSTKKIFVGGLPSSITEVDFKRYFDQFGTITDVVVMCDHNTQRPRGFGFITYDAEEAVDKVLYKTFHELNGKTVEVKRAIPKESSSSPGPTRTQSSSGYNYGAHRVVNNNFLNPYGHNSMSPVGRNIYPLTMDQSGYYPYGPNNYGMGLNLDFGLGLNHGTSADSGLNNRNGINSYFSASPSRFDSPILGDINNGGSVSLSNAINYSNTWGNESYNYGSNSTNSMNAFNPGGIGEIWARSSVLARDSGSENSLIGHGRYHQNNRVIRPNHLRNNDGNIDGLASTFNFVNNVRDARFGNLHGNDSFYSDHHLWPSLPDELDVSAGFISNYSVTAR